MASIRARKDNGLLFFDLRVKGVRCREQTALADTPENRKKMTKVLKKIEDEMEAGTFEYRRYFPNSKHAAQFDTHAPITTAASIAVLQSTVLAPTVPATPLLRDFAETWFSELSVGWRRSYLNTVRSILDQHLMPAFGERGVSSIRREDILAFRTTLAKVPGRKKAALLSPRRINAITLVLRQVLNEAADRFEFNTPTLRIKPLKVKKTDIQPLRPQPDPSGRLGLRATADAKRRRRDRAPHATHSIHRTHRTRRPAGPHAHTCHSHSGDHRS